MKNILKIALLLLMLSGSHSGKAQYYAIPDTNFRNYLYSQSPNLFNTTRQLIVANAKNFTGTISCQGLNIKDLSGLQFFHKITILNCSDNPLQSLPSLDSLKALQFLWILNCELLQLPQINHMSLLTTLDVKGNKLTELPALTGLVSLQYFDCSMNQLTSLPEISDLINLESLYCYRNKISVLPDVSSLSNLQILDCGLNNLAELPSLAGLINLRQLIIAANSLTRLPDLSKNVKLSTLNASDNSLRYIPDLSSHLSLINVELHGNALGFEELVKQTGHPSFSNVFFIKPQDKIHDYRDIKATRGESLAAALTFDSSVTGSTYTWYKNGSFYKTTTSNTLVFSPVASGDSGSYSCTIVNSDPLLQDITLEVTAFRLTIGECVTSTKYGYKILANKCSEGAVLEIDTVHLSGAFKPFSFKLTPTHKPQNQIVSNDIRLENIGPGKYDLEIIDQNHCSLILKDYIHVPLPGGCEHVITPNGDGVEDDFFIERSGNVKVYDKSGRLIKEFKAPGHWDATDMSGNLVPMGYYIILIEGKEKLGVVVVN